MQNSGANSSNFIDPKISVYDTVAYYIEHPKNIFTEGLLLMIGSLIAVIAAIPTFLLVESLSQNSTIDPIIAWNVILLFILVAPLLPFSVLRAMKVKSRILDKLDVLLLPWVFFISTPIFLGILLDTYFFSYWNQNEYLLETTIIWLSMNILLVSAYFIYGYVFNRSYSISAVIVTMAVQMPFFAFILMVDYLYQFNESRYSAIAVLFASTFASLLLIAAFIFATYYQSRKNYLTGMMIKVVTLLLHFILQLLILSLIADYIDYLFYGGTYFRNSMASTQFSLFILGISLTNSAIYLALWYFYRYYSYFVAFYTLAGFAVIYLTTYTLTAFIGFDEAVFLLFMALLVVQVMFLYIFTYYIRPRLSGKVRKVNILGLDLS